VTDRTREFINAAFEEELSSAPVPPSLRALSVRAAVAAPRSRSAGPQVLALVAAVLVMALVAAVFVGTHLRSTAPVPAGTTIPPAPRTLAASTYDEAHGVMVVFGGASGRTPPDSATWTWDGKYWLQLHPAVSPPARQMTVMAYDPAHHDVVLFGGNVLQKVSGKGGCCSYAPIDDTWTWNGTTWQERHPQHVPPIGFDFRPSLAYDPSSKSVLLLGFTQSHTEAMTDRRAEMWSWDGTDWKQLSPSIMPSVDGAMVTGRNGLILLEPATVGGRYLTQTWSWDGTSWTVLSPSVNLPSLGWLAATYDPVRRQIVVLSSDTWTWDGSTWTRQHPTVQPRTVGYLAFLPAVHEVVSWGDSISGADNEMFGWDGSDWKLLEPGTVVAPSGYSNGAFTVPVSVDQAAATVRATVKNTHPVLLPTVLPNGPYDARVVATPDDFSITYQSDLRDRTITFGIMAANPPPGGANPSDTRVRFRNAVALKYGPNGYAEYYVYDTSSPMSARWLMWLEPGGATNPAAFNGGVYYFLSAIGLTDQEFWQVANSLQ
jgi:hypothetical protein